MLPSLWQAYLPVLMRRAHAAVPVSVLMNALQRAPDKQQQQQHGKRYFTRIPRRRATALAGTAALALFALLSRSLQLPRGAVTAAVQRAPPPPLRAALGAGHAMDVTNTSDFQTPLVYALAAVSRATRLPRIKGAGSGSLLLYVYAQGLTRRTSVREQSYRIRVLGCVVNGTRYSLLMSTTGAYICEMPTAPVRGARVTLYVSPDVYISSPAPVLAARLRAQLADGLQPDGCYEVRSDAVWRSQRDGAPREGEARYELCLMTQERLFPELVPPWVRYHRRLGVDRVFIYDNSPKRGALRATLAKAGVHADVEVIHWPWPRSQFQAQNHFLLHARRRCVWVALMDVDEYLIAAGTRAARGALKKYLRDAVRIHRRSQVLAVGFTMGSSGLRYRSKRAPPDVYTHVTPKQAYSVKPIVYIEHALPATQVHTVQLFPGYIAHVASRLNETTTRDTTIGVAHYQGRSWEEYLIKAKGGRNSPQVQPFHIGAAFSWERPHWGYLARRKQDEMFMFRDEYRAVMRWRKNAPTLVSYPERVQIMRAFADMPRLDVLRSHFVNIMMESDDILRRQGGNTRSFVLSKNEWNVYIHRRNAT